MPVRGAEGGITVDPVTLIVTALGTGAALGVKETASAAVKDAYEGLKSSVKKRFAGREDGQMVLAQYEKYPAKWEPMLAGELTEAGADQDGDLIAAAAAAESRRSGRVARGQVSGPGDRQPGCAGRRPQHPAQHVRCLAGPVTGTS